jgi:two-component system, cell cycle sensor histidine kinase and response regulator CckA
MSTASKTLEQQLGETRQALQVSERRFQNIIAHNADGILVVDREGVVRFVNQAAERLLGRGADELVGSLFGFPMGAGQMTELDLLRRDGQVAVAEMHVTASEWDGHPVYLATLRDVTARKQAEDEVHFQAQLLEAVEQAIIATDLDGKIIYWNRFAERLYGWPADKVLGCPIEDITMAPGTEGQVTERMEQLQSGSSWSGELRVRRRDGATFPAMFIESPVHQDGHLAGIVHVAWDITEQKRATSQREADLEALRESEELFRTVFEQAAVGVAQVTPDGRFAQVNARLGEIVGYTKDELQDLTFRDITHPDDLHLDDDNIARVMAGETDTFEVERRYIHKDGHIVWIKLLSNVVRDAAGSIKYAIASVVDITQRRETDQKLCVSEEKFRTLIENTMDWIWQVDTEGTYTYASLNAEKLVGCKPEELCGKTPFDFMEAAEARHVGACFTALAAKHERIVALENTLIHKDGHPVVFETNATPLFDDAGAFQGYFGTCRDITARVQLENALRESKKRLRDVVSNVPGAVFQFIRRPDGTFQVSFMSDGAQTLFDRPAEELQEPSKLFDDIHPDDVSGMWTSIEESAQTMRPWRQEFRVLPQTGEPKWLRGVSSPRTLADGSICWTGMLLDVTEYKQAEAQREAAIEALRASEQQKDLILNSTAEMVAYYDTDLRVIWANRVSSESVGKSPEELIGRHCYEIWHQRDVPCANCPLLKARDVKAPRQSEQQTPDGRYWFLRGYPILDQAGQVVALVEFGQDISEQVQTKRARARLAAQVHEQAQQMEQVLSSVPAGVLLLDDQGRVLQANPVAEGDLAILSNVQVGERLTHLGDRALDELLTSPPTKGLWHEVKADNRTFEALARPVAAASIPPPADRRPDEAGPAPKHWVLVLNDVTREREIREQLEQQERLAAVGQLAAGIAHDFNNIMATIILYARTIECAEGLSERNRERLTTINQQAWHATRLIEQILDFSRRTVLERRPLDLLPLLKEQVKLLERTLPDHIEIALEYGRDEYTAHADPTRMQQVLTNLAVNARDAMPEGGMLRIGLERVQVEPGQSSSLPDAALRQTSSVSLSNQQGPTAGEWIRLTVSDTGTGIAPDTLPHIFEPFFTTKTPGQGSGLGLAQVYGIVGQHRGHIDIQTQVGEGTTFAIYLPALAVRPAESSPPDVSAIPQGQGEVILIVEDGDAVRAALVDSLAGWNYQTLEATNGKAALALMETQGEQIALILSDVVMPEMGGKALFHTLRERGWSTPVILLTGHPMEKELEALRTQGLSAWLSKPPGLKRLAQAVSDALHE